MLSQLLGMNSVPYCESSVLPRDCWHVNKAFYASALLLACNVPGSYNGSYLSSTGLCFNKCLSSVCAGKKVGVVVRVQLCEIVVCHLYVDSRDQTLIIRLVWVSTQSYQLFYVLCFNKF